MLRYLLKTLLQMNLFADSLAAEMSNSSELLLGINGSEAALDLRNLTAGNGSHPRLEDSAPRIVEHPSDLLVSRGEPATLSCRAEGRPSPTVEWYKDGERVETDHEDPRSHRMLLPSGSLFFLRIVHGRRSKPDEGIYVCVARNYLGEATSRNASLEVAVLRDDFRQSPGDVVVAAGEPAVLECIPPRGHPEPTVTWKKDGTRLSDKDERITIRGGKLMMATTRKSDAGIYVCVATNMVGERDSEPAELVVFERPAFGRRPQNQAVLEDQAAEFPCEALGDPPPTARWRREDGELPAGRWELLADNTLRISRVRAEDEGTYTCMAENSVGRSEASGTLIVRVPPQLITRPRNQTVPPGQTVTFQCETTGNPPPAVFWQKEGSQTLLFPGQSPPPASRISVASSGAMTIAAVQPTDAGYYLCQAISVAGSVLAKALLEVEAALAEPRPPVIRWGPANLTVLPVGATVQLPCWAEGEPPPHVGWLKDGRTMPGSESRASLLENGTLQISNMQVTDSGQYECVAISSMGEMRWSGSLQVQGDGSLLSTPPPEPGILPGPPSTPLVTNVTKSSVTLTWKGNEQSGGTTVTYIVEAFSEAVGGPWQTVAANVEGETHTVQGLTPDTTYLFLVRALNAHGLSDPSGISEPIRTQADTSPTPQVSPELRVAVHLQEPVVLPPGAVRLAWTVEPPSPSVQGYQVLYRRRGGRWEAWDVRAPGERGALLTGLRHGQDYEVKVRPFYLHLHGPDSAVRALRMPEAAPSAPPRAVSVAGNGTSVRISWQPPPPAEQNGVILDYRIWCLGNESRFHINQSVEGTVLATVLRGLVPGVPYRAEVAAATGAGVGARSAPISIRIAPPVEQDMGPVGWGSMAERMAAVARRPAFIAGVSGALWLILAGFAAWLYSRRRRRKELSHFTASFAFAPTGASMGAVGPRHGPTASSLPPPALSTLTFPHTPAPAHSSPRNAHPWLADAWRGGGLDATERYYNEAGISRYIAQTEPFGPGNAEGPIYSSIEAGGDELRTFHRPCSQHGPETLYGHSAPGQHGKNLGKAVQTPVLSWTELLPPPPSASELSQYTEEEEEKEEQEEMDEEEDGILGLEEHCPSTEDGPQRAASSPATPTGCWAPAATAPMPHEDTRSLQRFNSPRSPRRPPRGTAPSPSPPLSPRSPDTCKGPASRAHRPHGAGKTRSETPKGHPKPKGGRYPREQWTGGGCVPRGGRGLPAALSPRSVPAADLPPPPLPPPGETPSPSRETSGAERRAAHRPPRQGDVVPYSKPSFLARGCSTAGSASSCGSSGSRAHGSGRSPRPDPLAPRPPQEER
ncbi:roundabout homolog 3 [Lagopus muta]|uniref:roundabout homolog 3 n=1 Tax=Lagopus muta TaxID=64668 RepID=UPI00209E832E|nr:roundabout homolog 3 [Lagopus muta]